MRYFLCVFTLLVILNTLLSEKPIRGNRRPASELDQIKIGGMGQYDTAVDHAKRALLIQSGVEANYGLLKNYGQDHAYHLLQDAGLDKPLGASLYLYKVYRDQSVSLPVAKDKRLTLRPNAIELSIRF